MRVALDPRGAPPLLRLRRGRGGGSSGRGRARRRHGHERQWRARGKREQVGEHRLLHLKVKRRVNGQAWREVDFEQPWFERIIDDDVKTEELKGGIDRVLMFVQLLEQEALPRLSLVPVTASAVGAVVAVGDWLLGKLDDALSALGGELTPVAAGAFRGAVGDSEEADALAKLVIPLGLQGDQVVNGDAATRCVRRLQLALIPTGDEQVSGMVVLLSNAIAGALLPDGLRLEAVQGSHHQSVTSEMSSQLKLIVNAGDDVVNINLQFGEGKPIRLPALKLPE